MPSLGHGAEAETFILAWDPVTGEEKFRVQNEVYGATGVLATSGNLLFSGNHKGEFVAFDARDRQEAVVGPTQARVVAAPATYMVDGQQYVAILVGARGLPPGGKRTGRRLAPTTRASSSTRRAARRSCRPRCQPVATARPGVRIDPPLLTANNETVASGEQLFGANCAVCHGPATCPGGRLDRAGPALQRPARQQVDGWNGAVRDGDRAQRGMPSFAASLTAEQTDTILAYVIKRANDEKASAGSGGVPPELRQVR